jgi:hypothetical protein
MLEKVLLPFLKKENPFLKANKIFSPQRHKTTAHSSPVESCPQQARNTKFHWAGKAESSKY